jgi:hypothetical protein
MNHIRSMIFKKGREPIRLFGDDDDAVYAIAHPKTVLPVLEVNFKIRKCLVWTGGV